MAFTEALNWSRYNRMKKIQSDNQHAAMVNGETVEEVDWTDPETVKSVFNL